ncbi:MAG: thioredoxin-disulfide reductase [Isosphaeraceae bacterium]
MGVSEVLIIGSGSAGLTAALYAARAGLNPIVFEGEEPGGQLTLTTAVDNFPGFPDGIMGPDLMDQMRAQAKRFGAETRDENVTGVDLLQRPFRVKTRGGGQDREYEARALIIATGASARWLDIEAEKPFKGKGVHTCATCDGALYRNKEIAIVGGGDSAIEEATFLARFASKLYLIHRRDRLRASKIMQDRLFQNPKIQPVWNAVVEGIQGDPQDFPALTGVTLTDTTGGPDRQLPIQGLFLGIGHIPNTAIFRGQLATTPAGYLLTRTALSWEDIEAPAGLRGSMANYGTATSVEGVFGCGDVVDTHYRQAITAAGSGCAAAMDCEKWLETLAH